MELISSFYYTRSCIGVAWSIEQLQARVIVWRLIRSSRHLGLRRRFGDLQHFGHLPRVHRGLAVGVVVEEDERLVRLVGDLIDSGKPLLKFGRRIKIRVPVGRLLVV